MPDNADQPTTQTSPTGVAAAIAEPEHPAAGIAQDELRFQSLFDAAPAPVWIIEDNRFVGFVGLAPPRGLATLCTDHCMTCEALPIRAMRT